MPFKLRTERLPLQNIPSLEKQSREHNKKRLRLLSLQLLQRILVLGISIHLGLEHVVHACHFLL